MRKEPVIITRYGIMNSDPEWYAVRMPFVKKYFDSLRQQTYKDWTALILVDDSIPPKCLTDLNRLAFDDRMDISKRAPKDPFDEETIQIRIDSDDYIATDFVEKVVDSIEPGHILDFAHGYMELDGKYYERVYPHNMFMSLWAKESVYQTAHDLMHIRYERIAPKTDHPMWVHCVHSGATTWDKNKDQNWGEAVIPDKQYFPYL